MTLEKVITTIEKYPSPKDVTQLKFYLGLLNFYTKFIPMSLTLLQASYNLFKKNVKFVWPLACHREFKNSRFFD